MVPFILLGVALVAAAAAAYSQPAELSTAELCALSADRVPLQGRLLRTWLLCEGRTSTEVRQLTDRLQAAGDVAGARAIADVWAARGVTYGPELPPSTQAAAQAALGASDVEASRPDFVSTAPASTPTSSTTDALQSSAANALRAIRASITGGRVARTRIAAVQTFQRLVPSLTADGLYGSNTRVALAHYSGEPEAELPPAASLQK